MMCKEIAWPKPHGRPANPEMKKFGLWWIEMVQELLHQGKIREHPMVVESGGVGKVLDGMQLIREKKISGKKLVYTMK